MDARAGGSDGRKPFSATANEARTRGRYGAWEQRTKNGGRSDWEGAEPSGVGGNFGGREASGVDPETHGVGWEKGGREASGAEEISTLELVLCCWKLLQTSKTTTDNKQDNSK